VFNFEGGCYAKVIQLSPSAEPQIHATTRMFGTLLENVVFDPVTRLIDLDSELITENTRASYPLDFISNALPEKRAGHPKNIVFLTCDAQGVMPPIARLEPDQALYQFVSGYTSKVAGTEAGLGREPQLTFSACFGGPFMVHHPYFYADLLKRKMLRYGVTVWLVNTGWVGGPYGIGKRISIRYTRALLNTALNGGLKDVPSGGSDLRVRCAAEVRGVPDSVLNPADAWGDKGSYKLSTVNWRAVSSRTSASSRRAVRRRSSRQDPSSDDEIAYFRIAYCRIGVSGHPAICSRVVRNPGICSSEICN
jgi:phosphoenolpyruvate carboxykinase (ATP)